MGWNPPSVSSSERLPWIHSRMICSRKWKKGCMCAPIGKLGSEWRSDTHEWITSDAQWFDATTRWMATGEEYIRWPVCLASTSHMPLPEKPEAEQMMFFSFFLEYTQEGVYIIVIYRRRANDVLAEFFGWTSPSRSWPSYLSLCLTTHPSLHINTPLPICHGKHSKEKCSMLFGKELIGFVC